MWLAGSLIPKQLRNDLAFVSVFVVLETQRLCHHVDYPLALALTFRFDLRRGPLELTYLPGWGGVGLGALALNTPKTQR